MGSKSLSFAQKLELKKNSEVFGAILVCQSVEKWPFFFNSLLLFP